MKTLRSLLAIVLAALVAVPAVEAGWDKTKPVNGTPFDATEITNNWAALEKANGLSLMRDPAYEIWLAGTTSAPSAYVLAGTGATIVRTGTGEGDTTRKVGKYAAKVTFGSAAATLCQDVFSTTTFDTGLRGRIFSLGQWVQTSTASIASVEITDGVGTTSSSLHAGSGSFSWLTVTRTLDASATKLTVCGRVAAAGNAYFSASALLVGELPPDDYRPPVLPYDLNTGTVTAQQLSAGTLSVDAPPTFRPGASAAADAIASGRVSFNVTAVGNVGAGTDNLMSDTIKADWLNANGKVYRYFGAGDGANNANGKVISATLDGTTIITGGSFTTQFFVTAGTGGWEIEITVIREDATHAKVFTSFRTQAGTTRVTYTRVTVANWTADRVLQITGTATADNDIVQQFGFGEVIG